MRTRPTLTPADPSDPGRHAVAPAVEDLLREARARGFLGPGPVTAHITHAAPLLDVLPADGTVVDLGSGGGVPALVLAAAAADRCWVLVESQQRRATWLVEAVARLGLTARVVVAAERAEVVGRGTWRGRAAAVTARAFGRPAVVAECAAPLLAPGGTCWVADPPVPDPQRWPAAGLAELGMVGRGAAVPGWTAIDQVGPCPDRYPRRVGIPAKRPLF
jgi:16S rRNA (guanine527-N7)-methyltransferase